MSEIRRYERIDIELPCRLFIPGAGDGDLRFEAYCTSRNLGLGGLFVASSFLLREGLDLFVELALPDGPLPIRSRVSHVVGHGDRELETGMGIEFLDVDAHGRETLLRYFSPGRYHAFYEAFTGEFAHLKKALPLRDVSLVLNLWEEWKIKNEGGPASTASGAPPAPARAGARPAPAPLPPARRSGRGGRH
jgi:Tfp pilus assembly protein PilZ